MSKTVKSQNERILATLRNVGSITNVKARSRGIKNLRARISELRDGGHSIESVSYTRRDGVRAARYELS